MQVSWIIISVRVHNELERERFAEKGCAVEYSRCL